MNSLRNILICLAIFFTQFIPSYANASPWNNMKATATALGAQITGDAIVGGASRTATATAPWASIKNGLGKGLKGGGTLLLGAAIYAALSATDYVQDPANNSIIYKPVTASCNEDGSNCSGYQYIWGNSTFGFYASAQAACSAYVAWEASQNLGFTDTIQSVNVVSSTSATCIVTRYSPSRGESWTENIGVTAQVNPAYDESAPAVPQTKTITIPELLQLLIDQMNNNDAAIKNVLDQILETSIAQAQSVANTDADLKAMLATMINLLDANKEYATSNTATGTQTTTSTGSDLKIEFPKACSWFAIGCEAAQVVIDFPTKIGGWWDTMSERWTTLGEWWNTIKGWQAAAAEYVDSLFAEPDLPEEDNTIPDSTVAPDLPSGNYISFSSTCPFSNQNNSIEINGQTTTIQNDMSDACDIATQMRPVVLFLSGLISFGIIAGFNFSGSTQDD